MPTIELDDGFGFADFAVAGMTARLDLWEANNVYARLAAQHPDAVALGDAWVGWLAEKGLPGLSHGAGFRVQDAVAREIEGVRKNDHPPGDSPPPG